MTESKAVMHASLAALLAGSLFVGGCATKKYVRGTVQPVSDRVSQVDQRTTQNSTQIENLDRQVSRNGERISDVDSRATSAGQAAQQAQQAAQGAQKSAEEARQYASTRADQLQQSLTKGIESIDDFQVVSTENVLFRRSRHTLTKDEQAKLDQVAMSVNGMRRYVIEVVGHTDRSGSKEYNQMLSEKRANAVIRYLTLQHNVPLRNIRVIGLGEEAAALARQQGMMANNTTGTTAQAGQTASQAGQTSQMAEGAAANAPMTPKESRRVEIRVFAPAGAQGGNSGVQTSTTGRTTETSISAQR